MLLLTWYRVKTKVQQRALAGEPRKSVWVTLSRLVRGKWYHLSHLLLRTYVSPTGTDQNHPKPILLGLSRLYRGLGVSALRSVTTHGLLWTVLDYVSGWIDRLPLPRPGPPSLAV